MGFTVKNIHARYVTCERAVVGIQELDLDDINYCSSVGAFVSFSWLRFEPRHQIITELFKSWCDWPLWMIFSASLLKRQNVNSMNRKVVFRIFEDKSRWWICKFIMKLFMLLRKEMWLFEGSMCIVLPMPSWSILRILRFLMRTDFQLTWSFWDQYLEGENFHMQCLISGHGFSQTWRKREDWFSQEIARSLNFSRSVLCRTFSDLRVGMLNFFLLLRDLMTYHGQSA